MSTYAVKYDQNDFVFVRAFCYSKLAFHERIQQHKPNLTERVGNAMITALKYLPNCFWLAASELGLTTNAYLIFPLFFMNAGESGSALLPTPTFFMLQVTACAYTTLVALGYVLRAAGRYTNPELMADFYSPS